MKYFKSMLFNKVFIGGYIREIHYLEKGNKCIKILLNNDISASNNDNCIEIMVYKKNLIHECESWCRINHQIMVDGFISVIRYKDEKTQSLHRKQVIKADRIGFLSSGEEFY